MTKAVMDGSLDMALIIPSSAFSDVGIPEASTMALPRLFKNESQLYKFLEREDGYKRVEKILNERHVRILDNIVMGKYHIYTQKPINTVADFKGVKTRLSSGPVNTVGKTMGMVPTELPVSDVYMGLQQKTLDACATGIDTYVNRKWYEVAKYLPINWPFLYYSGALITNDKSWDKLSPDLKKIMLEKVMPEMHKYGLEMKEKMWAKMEEDSRKAGANVYNVPEETIKEFDNIIVDKAFPELRKISPLMSELIDVAKDCAK